MQIVVVGTPGFWPFLMDHWVEVVEYDPVVLDRLRDLGSRHRVSVYPEPKDIDHGLRELVLSPSFYEDCANRIKDRLKRGVADEATVMAAVIAEAAPSIARELDDRVRNVPRDESFSSSLLQAYSRWRLLEDVIAAAYPEASDLLGENFQHRIGIRFSDLVARADRMWELGGLLYPPDYIDGIAALEPRLIVLHGSFPADLPGAVMLASRLRPMVPDAKLILYPSTTNLYTSFAHTRDSVLGSDDLFGLVDGVPMYTDIRDLTLCDIIDRVASGAPHLGGIENLACTVDGRITYTEPSQRTIERYLDDVVLGQALQSLVSGTADPPNNSPTTSASRTSAMVNAVKQPCYWDRCRFCGSSSQRAVRHDPHFDRRAQEAADLMVRLDRSGVDMSFVGFDVVPEAVLRHLVAALTEVTPTPRWSFEGRFEDFYTDGFVQSLADSGCRGIIFGLESPSDHLNAAMCKRNDELTIAHIEHTIDALDHAGISVHVNTIIDLPGGTGEEFIQHQSWLQRMFDTHDLFHFNTNTFAVFPGSAIAEDPGNHGIEVLDYPTEDFFLKEIPHRRLGSQRAVNSGAIWRSVFGASTYQGCDLELLHVLYHEYSGCAFSDARDGRNLFKEIQAELRRLRDIGGAHMSLREGVEVVEAEGPDLPYVWLVDLGGTAGWTRLSFRLWDALENGMEQELTVDESLDAAHPGFGDTEREDAYQAVRELASTGFLKTEILTATAVDS